MFILLDEIRVNFDYIKYICPIEERIDDKFNFGIEFKTDTDTFVKRFIDGYSRDWWLKKLDKKIKLI